MIERPTRRGLAALCLALATLTGCIEFDLARSIQLRRPDHDFDLLVVGETDLEEALEELGAPLQVYEVGRDVAVVWGWYKGSGWGVQVSVPIGDEQGSVSYQDNTDKVEGLLLLFDQDWSLLSARTGNLSELTRTVRVRPQVWEDLEDPVEHHGNGRGPE